jgi:hypothetical protein
MKIHTLLITTGLLCAGTVALLIRPSPAFAQAPTQLAAGAPTAEASQFCGENGLQVEMRRMTHSDTSDRLVIVRKLPLKDRRLVDDAGRSVVTDFRVPASGSVIANGVLIPMTLDAHGELRCILPSAGVHWFSSNAVQVSVLDAQGNLIWELGLAT